MRQLLAYEHQWIPVGDDGSLSRQEADHLAAAEPSLPGGCLEWGRQRVKFKQFCGVVRLTGLQLEVLPKLFPYQTPAHQRETLLTLLARGGEIEALRLQSAMLDYGETTLLDTFIRHFARLLERELRQGMLQDYQEVEDNLGQVRGRIDLVRQQRENLSRPQRLACRFNELSPNIAVNRLLRTALDLLHALAHNPLLRQYIGSLRMRFAHVPHLARHEWAPRGDELNRLQRRYAPVVDLAHQFLAGQFLDVRTGQTPIFSLLFDMNRLFERYAASLLQPEVRRSGMRLVEQGPRQYLVGDSYGSERLLMRPDIALMGTSGNLVTIIDTKWKTLGYVDPMAALSTADLYQVSTYASAYGCKSVTLLYPEQQALSSHDVAEATIRLKQPFRLSVRAIPIGGERRQKGWAQGFVGELGESGSGARWAASLG